MTILYLLWCTKFLPVSECVPSAHIWACSIQDVYSHLPAQPLAASHQLYWTRSLYIVNLRRYGANCDCFCNECASLTSQGVGRTYTDIFSLPHTTWCECCVELSSKKAASSFDGRALRLSSVSAWRLAQVMLTSTNWLKDACWAPCTPSKRTVVRLYAKRTDYNTLCIHATRRARCAYRFCFVLYQTVSKLSKQVQNRARYSITDTCEGFGALLFVYWHNQCS